MFDLTKKWLGCIILITIPVWIGVGIIFWYKIWIEEKEISKKMEIY
jgi:hypothetical protein